MSSITWQPRIPAEEAVWSRCAYPIRVDDRTFLYDDGRATQPALHFACVQGPTVDGEAFDSVPELGTGPIIQFQFRCVVDGTTTVELLARDERQYGTYFLTPSVDFVDPTLVGATIMCGP
jgi:hypothetical protein